MYTDNTMRPSDIKQLYAGYRRVILLGVDMKNMNPRETFDLGSRIPQDIYQSDNVFSHGLTLKAIRNTMWYIRDCHRETSSEKSHNVFMSKIRDVYKDAAINLGKGAHMIMDDRTLKNYLCPSLAATNILPRIGSRKVGTYFCCWESFDVIAAQTKAPKSEDVTLCLSEKGDVLDEVERLFKITHKVSCALLNLNCPTLFVKFQRNCDCIK